jgi:hypothetical protein
LKFVWQEVSRNPHTPQRTRRVLHLEKEILSGSSAIAALQIIRKNRLSFFAPQMLRSEKSVNHASQLSVFPSAYFWFVKFLIVCIGFF